MRKYRVVYGRIEYLDVVSETERMLYGNMEHFHNVRWRKDYRVFDTWESAHQALVESSKNDVKTAKRILDGVLAMEKPKEKI